MPRDQAAGNVVQVGVATVPGGPDAPFAARAAVSSLLADRASAELLDDVRLLVSELVTNSVLHAGQPPGAPVRIRALAGDDVIRVEVQDGGHGPLRPRAPDPPRGGFGLHLLELLAARWGASQERGTRVWFELAAATTAVPGAAQDSMNRR